MGKEQKNLHLMSNFTEKLLKESWIQTDAGQDLDGFCMLPKSKLESQPAARFVSRSSRCSFQLFPGISDSRVFVVFWLLFLRSLSGARARAGLLKKKRKS